MPNHCFQGGVSNPIAFNSDWTVNFNPDVTGILNYDLSAVNSSTLVSSLLCSLQTTASSNMISGNGYVENTSTLRDLQGGMGPPPGGPPPNGGGGSMGGMGGTVGGS